MGVRIFKPSKTATQSGVAHTRYWVLEHEAQKLRGIDPLMGWTSSGDTTQQISLTFRTKDQAISFAEKNGLSYTVESPPKQKRRHKSYADNFRHDKVT